MRPVVIAYDGSPAARAAVRDAAELFAGRRLLVASVWEAGLAYAVQTHADLPGVEFMPSQADVATVDHVQSAHAQSLAETGVALAREHGADAEAVPVADLRNVADTLERLAEEHDAAAVVVGTRGHGGLRSRVLGSTSRRLVDRCRRPVMVVHATGDDAPAGRSTQEQR